MNILNFIFLQCPKAEIWIPHSEYSKHALQVKKSLKHDNINKFCLLVSDEHVLNFIFPQCFEAEIPLTQIIKSYPTSNKITQP